MPMDHHLKLSTGHLDVAGTATSLTCALHCALLPLVLTLLPAWGLSFLADGRVEWLMVGSAALLGGVSLSAGYRQHRSKRALALLAAALTLLVLGRLAESGAGSIPGEVLMVAGGLVLAGGHALNFTLCRRCQCCQRRDRELDGSCRLDGVT